MKILRIFCCFVLLAVWGAPLFADQPPEENALILQLQQENAALKLKMGRLESHVVALREEMSGTDPSQIIAGIGYIVGIFGVAGWLAAHRMAKRETD